MEKRLIISLVLSISVFVVWSVLFPPQQPEKVALQTASTESVQDASFEESAVSVGNDNGKITADKVISESDSEPVEAETMETIRIRTEEWTVELTNKGARVSSWILNHYTDNEGEPLELVNRYRREQNDLPLGLFLDNSRLETLVNNSLFEVNKEERSDSTKVTFRYGDGKGLSVVKVMEFPRNGYLFNCSVSVMSGSETLNSYFCWGPEFGNRSTDKKTSRFYLADQLVLSSSNNEVKYLKKPKVLGKLKSQNASGFLTGLIWKSLPYRNEKGDILLDQSLNWASVGDNYFAVVFIGNSPFKSVKIRGYEGEPDEKGEVAVSSYALGVPSQDVSQIFVGPKDYSVLKPLGSNYDQLIDLGVFWFVAKPLMIALTFLQKYISNYGFCIIILTIIIKLFLYPLTHKSFVSMKKMQKLQPKMKAIQKKYGKKKDPESREKQSREMMELYKTEGVNPMSGCMPMLLQMPVLWAFYKLLTVSIALRQAPFIFWIGDLSMPDPYYVTPIIMGATMYIQQNMSTTPAGNEMQQKMFKMMPVVFTIMFLNFPSGLVLYWLTNSILTVGQQYLINKYTD